MHVFLFCFEIGDAYSFFLFWMLSWHASGFAQWWIILVPGRCIPRYDAAQKKYGPSKENDSARRGGQEEISATIRSEHWRYD